MVEGELRGVGGVRNLLAHTFVNICFLLVLNFNLYELSGCKGLYEYA